MRCTSCHEKVQEGAAMRIDSDLVCAIVAGTPEEGATVYSVRAHIRYVRGDTPAGPETSVLHAWPLICGPLEES